MIKLSNRARRIMLIRLLTMNSDKRGKYLKKKKVFYQFGDNVTWASHTIPAELFWSQSEIMFVLHLALLF